MIRFSLGFIKKLMGAEKDFEDFQGKLYAKESEISIYNTRGEGYVDVRSTLNTPESEDKKLLEHFFMFKNEWLDLTALQVANYVNRIMTYRRDEDEYKKPEFWKSPFETFQQRRGDCDDYALLIMKVWQLLGIPESRRKVWCGDIFSPDGKYAGGHAVPIYLSYATNEWYPLEGSYYGKETNSQFNLTPLWDNRLYGRSWFVFSESKSYAGTRFGGGKE